MFPIVQSNKWSFSFLQWGKCYLNYPYVMLDFFPIKINVEIYLTDILNVTWKQQCCEWDRGRKGRLSKYLEEVARGWSPLQERKHLNELLLKFSFIFKNFFLFSAKILLLLLNKDSSSENTFPDIIILFY